VADDAARAVIAYGREGVDRAFEAVERVHCPGHRNFKALVVLVIADFARCHKSSLQILPAMALPSCNGAASGENVLFPGFPKCRGFPLIAD
jgi:hypothetical protein